MFGWLKRSNVVKAADVNYSAIALQKFREIEQHAARAAEIKLEAEEELICIRYVVPELTACIQEFEALNKELVEALETACFDMVSIGRAYNPYGWRDKVAGYKALLKKHGGKL